MADEIDVTPVASRIDSEARKYAKLAVQVLVTAMTEAYKEADRIHAARELLLWGYGTPGRATITPPTAPGTSARLHGVSDADLLRAAQIANGGGGSTPRKGDPAPGSTNRGSPKPSAHQTDSAPAANETTDVGAMDDAALEARIRQSQVKRIEYKDAIDGEFTEASNLWD